MDYSKRLHNVIPGGAHTYSRGDDQFPSNAPSILTHGEGAYVFDINNSKYLDYGMGLRSVNIGYGNLEIADASYNEILKGNNLTRPSLTELRAAELFCEVIPSAEMVKFAKHGSTVTTAAVKLARAYTGKKFVVLPEEQPFFSFDDWFIGTTVMDLGTLKSTSDYTLKFNYNNIQSLEDLFLKYKDQIACVIMEAATNLRPCNETCDSSVKCNNCLNNSNNFLNKVQNLCKKNGAVFILDEMITGFRWDLHGAQSYYNIEPDLCTFGKAMANGFAVAALAGKKEIMNMGSILNEGKERLFLTSTTHGAEMSGLGAFLKTIEILKRDSVIDHFWNYGKKLISSANEIFQEHGISDYIKFEGYHCSPNYITRGINGEISFEMRTLFAQEMINNGVIMPYVALSASHKESELDKTITAIRNTAKVYTMALNDGVSKFLKSTTIKPVFRKYN